MGTGSTHLSYWVKKVEPYPSHSIGIGLSSELGLILGLEVRVRVRDGI